MTRALISRAVGRVRPDPSRVVARLFVPGQEVVGGTEGRASEVVARVLALDEGIVLQHLTDLVERFEGRHPDILATFSHHADRIGNRLEPEAELSRERWLLLGAAFTHEYAVEAAALCNPSIVAAPDQEGASDGELRVIMSVRGIGEGHRSSIGFREGAITREGAVQLEDPGPHLVAGAIGPGTLTGDVLHGSLRAVDADGESATSVIDQLGPSFDAADLERWIDVLLMQRDTRLDAPQVAAALRAIAARSYHSRFPEGGQVAQRVLEPAMAAESHGMEDARFVRFVEDDGVATWYATYTAFDGALVRQQLLATDDFRHFRVSPVVGAAATDKGLALFPRRIGGRYAALSRRDRETNAIAYSDSLTSWDDATTLQVPQRGWEIIQLGNCGSPIETPDGWLVLTHGVGPMRTYSIGAILLDLHDPATVLATLAEPLLTPTAGEQDGYVPNVVYSCGGILHHDTVVLPYGIGDASIAFATVRWPDLLGAMERRQRG